MVNFSGNSGYYNAFEPSLAAYSDDVYFAWHEETNGGPNIILAKSSDSGKKFTYNQDIAPEGAWPSISVQGNDVYMLFGYQDNTTPYTWAFTGSREGAKTFSNPIIIGSYLGGLRPREDFSMPMMTADGANIHVVWKYYTSNATDSVHDVFLVTSFDESRNFTTPINLSQNADGDVHGRPEADAREDKVFVLWQEQVSNYPDILLREGKILGPYTDPFREVSSTVPNESSNSTLLAISFAAVAGGVGAGVIHYLRKRIR